MELECKQIRHLVSYTVGACSTILSSCCVCMCVGTVCLAVCRQEHVYNCVCGHRVFVQILHVSQCVYYTNRIICKSWETWTPLTHLHHWEGRASRGLEEGRDKPSFLPGVAHGPHRYSLTPSEDFLTVTLLSLPCLGLRGRCCLGWPSGSSKHLPCAFQQHTEQWQNLSGQGIWRGSSGGEV